MAAEWDPNDKIGTEGEMSARESDEQRSVTSFLLALSGSVKMRDRYRDPNRRKALLAEWDLDEDKLFQPGATEEDFRARVLAEGGRLAQVEWWMCVASEPVANLDYDPNA